MKTLTLDLRSHLAPTRDHPYPQNPPDKLPTPSSTHIHPSNPSTSLNASLFFVGTATTILEWAGLRLMTDPNFLHAGDHVHLGPGVTGARITNPAVELSALPPIDLVLLSHYHADHFDEVVEKSLRRDLPIVTTPHASQHLTGKKGEGEAFTAVHAVEFWEDLFVDFQTSTETDGKARPRIKVTGMPGKHVPDGVLGTANEFLKAVPPTNGWMLELGYSHSDVSASADSKDAARGDDDDDDESFTCSYRIYISGDTLLVSDLSAIPSHYTHAGRPIDLMLIHLGGTTIPGPSLPLLMVTMDAKQGIELVKLISPDLTIPIHYDDYDVFLSPLEDFKREVDGAGLGGKVVYLGRGEEYSFRVKGPGEGPEPR